MADEIQAEGKSYVSSKRAAQISGYAQDYIGQLCRAGLIDARRIGGLWYVVLDSLYKHKQKADSYVPNAPRRTESAGKEALVSFDGKDYLSTARAAEITGYAKDYVGQLARQGAVISRQVGSRWYVERGSILAHKREKDALLAAVQTEAVGIARSTVQKNPESLANARDFTDMPLMKYTSDERELFPTIASGPLRSSDEYKETTPVTAFAQEESAFTEVSNLGPTRHHAIPIRIVKSGHSGSWTQRDTLEPHRSKKGLHLAQAGALVTGMATIVVFIALGLVSLKDSALYTARQTEDRMFALSVESATDLLSEVGAALERSLVKELIYKRSDLSN